jgi:hypothetical protein
LEVAEARISEINWKPYTRPWVDVIIGYSMIDLFEMGVKGCNLIPKLKRGWIVFDPPVTIEDVQAEFKLYSKRKRQLYKLEHGGQGGRPGRPRGIGHPTTPRKCMTCRKTFPSVGIQNRLCEPCAKRGGDLSPYHHR